jgi:DNA helicase-2/ATP-dependent DNA helicase PcrA
MEDGLNAPQAAAVRHGDGPLLILAGAGSGKTRVITHRIAALLHQGVPAWRILAVTFTNKAAGEMRERVARLVGERGKGMRIGTFHATSAFILRQNAAAAGLPRDFTIFDDDDQRRLIIRVMKDLSIEGRYATPRQILSAIDGAKNKGQGPGEYQGEDYFTDLVARAYPVYQQRLEQAGGVDFGDLLWKALRLCSHPEVGPHLAGRWEHVLVDEFQDTNRVQYELVRHLSSQSGNLCVVGDDDQSIYAWRGADVRNILDFEKDHPGAEVVKLEQNYRSTQTILDAANAVIAKNWDRKAKRLFTEAGPGEPILYYTAEDERSEASFVVRTIRKLENDEGRNPDDFAVFYRTHAQSRAIEEALRAADLGYTIVGGIRFYDRAEVRDLLAYLRVLANPADEISLERIINRPARGIGDTTYDKIVELARAKNVTVYEALRAAAAGEAGLGPSPRRKVGQFAAMLDEVRDAQLPLSAIADVVLEKSKYLEVLSASNDHEDEARIENLMELVGSMRDFEQARARDGESATLVDYLEMVSLVSPVDSESKGVTLMTVHAAKGLEFPVVFVTGLEDGVFPSLRNGEDEAAIAEERRLAYVSITRARERLFLSNARYRRLFGRDAAPFRESRFLADIPDSSIARPVQAARARPAWLGATRSPAANAAPARTIARGGGISVEYDEGYVSHHDDDSAHVDARFRLGQRVRHAKFGEGEVRALSGAGDDLKLTVYFGSFGPKTVIARFVEAV